MTSTRTQKNTRHHALYYRRPTHNTQPNNQLGGIGLDLTITRYTEDCEERARSMQHLVNSLSKEARTAYVPCYYLQFYNHIVL